MREVNVHDLGLDDAEQELLALSEGRQRPRQRQTPLFENPVNDDNGDGVGLSWVFAVIVLFLIVEPNGLARLWAIIKEKLRLWPFPY